MSPVQQIRGTDVLDGTITGTDITDGSIGNAELGPDVARAQLLVNGGFEVWSRGAGPFTTGVYAADRWSLGIGSGSTLSVTRDTGNVDTGSGAAAVATYTHSTTSFLLQKLEDYGNVRGRTLSLSVRVRTSTANAVFVQIQDNVSNVSSGMHSGNGTYQTLTATYTVAANATVVQVAIFFQASCTAYVDNAALVVGSQPANYVPLHPVDDYTRCLRYYETYGGLTSPELLLTGQAYGTTAAFMALRFNSRKPVVPTITLGGPGSSFALSNSGGGNVACSTVSGSAATVENCRVDVSVATGLTGGNATILIATAGSGYFVIEANP